MQRRVSPRDAAAAAACLGQVECADILVLNKMDTLEESKQGLLVEVSVALAARPSGESPVVVVTKERVCSPTRWYGRSSPDQSSGEAFWMRGCLPRARAKGAVDECLRCAGADVSGKPRSRSLAGEVCAGLLRLSSDVYHRVDCPSMVDGRLCPSGP